MKITVAAIGRLKEPYLVAACAEYEKRLRPYCTLAVTEHKDEAALLGAVGSAVLFAFDERGEQITSAELAKLLADHGLHGAGAPLQFAIGGADGHTDALRSRARRLFAFGRMTIAHRLVRILVLEQLYRAFKISRGEPYHRD